MQTSYRKYLDPEVVGKLKGMELRARMVVEGFIAGLHKSPYHGFSVEFAEHRQYMPGDNIRMSINLIAPIAMDEGLRFAIREGGRTVGAGVVAKIIE